MRFVHPARALTLELTRTSQGLLEAEYDPANVFSWADERWPRRALKQTQLVNPKLGDDFLAVRSDELLEQGWVLAKGDAGVLQALSNFEPWRGWPEHLAVLWGAWASPETVRVVLQRVRRITVALTSLRFAFHHRHLGDAMIQCGLPLPEADVVRLSEASHALLRCHAQVQGTGFWPMGWSPGREMATTGQAASDVLARAVLEY
jgi:hypothetical protein